MTNDGIAGAGRLPSYSEQISRSRQRRQLNTMDISSTTARLSTTSSKPSSGLAGNRTGSSLRRLYRFTVIALSVLLLVMAVWRPSPSGHVAEIILRHQEADTARMVHRGILDATETAANGPSHVDGWFQDGAHLRELAVGWTQSPNSPLAGRALPERTAWADEFVARLSYLMQTDNNGTTQIAVRVIDADPAIAVWALQTLSDQFVADHVRTNSATEIVERIGSIESELRSTSEQARIVQEDVQEFVRLQLQQRRQAFAANAAQAAQAAEAEASSDNEHPQAINPEWQSLRESLHIARQEFHELTQSRTQEHPELTIRRGQIAQLEEQIAQTPMHLSAPTTTPTPQVATNDSVDTADSTVGGAASEFDVDAAMHEIEFSEEYQRLYAARSELAIRRHELEQTRDQLPTRDVLLCGSVGVQAPTKISSTLKGRYLLSEFLGLVLLSAVLGLVFALWPTRILQPAVMYSVQDAADTLGLPVIGAVSCPGGQTVPSVEVGHPTPATWTATRFGELVLVSIVLLMLFLLIGDRGFGSQLFRDPFAAYTTALDQVIHWLI